MLPKYRRKTAAYLPVSMLMLFLLPSVVAAEDTTRTYYIAAEEIAWDYTPSWPMNPVTGEEFSEAESIYLQGVSRTRIGHRYRKAVYRQYTDDSFSAVKPRPPEMRHLGILGPAIRATVGDTIRVVFRNRLEDRAVSMHPHGLLYGKDSEGSGYSDGTTGQERADDGVEPGATHVYTWQVPPRAGPGPADPGSVVWLYHSDVSESADIHAGLLGPIIISRRFQARDDATPADAHREFVTMFMVFDENKSFLADANRESLAPAADPGDPGYRRSNRMHSINGYLYGNLPDMQVEAGQRVRWHVVTPGAGAGLHAPHWHGNGVTAYGSYTDIVNLMPAAVKSVTMEADNPGTWLFHCHVGDHTEAGMSSLFTVRQP